MIDLRMYRGDDRTLTVTATESLATAEVRWTARWSRHHDAEAVIEKSSLGVDPSITIAESVATVAIDAADTEDLLPGPLYWDVEITDDLGKVRTVAVGRLRLLPDVTFVTGGS
jgi:hypothetical protein